MNTHKHCNQASIDYWFCLPKQVIRVAYNAIQVSVINKVITDFHQEFYTLAQKIMIAEVTSDEIIHNLSKLGAPYSYENTIRIFYIKVSH